MEINKNKNFWVLAQKYGMLLALIVFVIILSIVSPVFLTVDNFLNVGRQASLTALMAAGMTIVIISAGIDLSIGGLLALTSATVALLLQSGFSPFWAIVLTLLVGILGGGFNGFFASRTKIAPFIITLATMSIFRGITLLITGASPVIITNDSFGKLGQGHIASIPIPIYIMIIFFLLTYILLKKTKFGRYVYAIGGNEESATLAGINVKNTKLIIYIIAGLFVAISGILYASRLQSGSPTIGEGIELDIITAVILGGTSFTGGRGGIGGTVIGVLILSFLDNGLNLLGVSAYFQDIVTGFVVLLAVVLDRFIQSRVAE